MKHIKKVLALFSALFFVISPMLVSCHGSKGMAPFEVPDSFDESKEYEISFWAKNDTNKTQTAIYEKAIEDFEALYPNIKVNIRLYTDYRKIYNDVITNISTNTTPNVCITYPDHIATYMTGVNTVVPLDGLIGDETFGLGSESLRFESPTKDEIIPKFLNECVLGENIFALPFMRSSEACYVNKTMVEELGFTLPKTLTWDFVWEVSDAAAKKDADGTYYANGQKIMIPFIYKSTDNMMISMLYQQNAPYSTAQGEIQIFNDTTRDLLKGIASHVEKGSFSTFKISSYPANFLNAGQCIFAVDSTAGATWMGTDAPLSDISPDKLVEFETEVMTVPQFDTENPKMISQGPSVCIFNKYDSGEVLASWLFAQYLLTNEVQIAYSETEGYIPVTSNAQNTPEYKEYLASAGIDNSMHYDVKIKAASLILEHTDDTFTTPVFNGSASLRDAACQLIEETTKSVRRKETVDDEYFDKLYRDVNSLFRLDQKKMSASEKSDLGPFPAAAIVLMVSLCVVWILIGLYVLIGILKKKRAK